MSTVINLLHNDCNIVKAQPGNNCCPISSFKHYINLLHPKNDAFFQRPSRDKKKYDNMVLGKGPLAHMMKVISEHAKLSEICTQITAKGKLLVQPCTNQEHHFLKFNIL